MCESFKGDPRNFFSRVRGPDGNLCLSALETVAIDTSSPSISSRKLINSASETDGFSISKISMSSKSSPVNLLHFVPPLARGLIESFSQNFRQIFVMVFTESFNSSEK